MYIYILYKTSGIIIYFTNNSIRWYFMNQIFNRRLFTGFCFPESLKSRENLASKEFIEARDY
jgi:hypothetical protein